MMVSPLNKAIVAAALCLVGVFFVTENSNFLPFWGDSPQRTTGSSQDTSATNGGAENADRTADSLAEQNQGGDTDATPTSVGDREAPPVSPPQFAPSTIASPPPTVNAFTCAINVFQLNSIPPIRYQVKVSSDSAQTVVMRFAAGSSIEEIATMSLIDGQASRLFTVQSRMRPSVEVFSDPSLSPESLGCRR